MAFSKTSVGLTAPKTVDSLVDSPPPIVGDEKDGKIWDGEKWVTKAEWGDPGPQSKLPGTSDPPG